MSLIDSLKDSKGNWQSNATVNIKLGDGNNNIDIAAANAFVDTGDGNLTLNSTTTGFLFVDSGEMGYDNITAQAGGSAIMNLYSGGSTVDLFASSAAIYADCGAQNIEATTVNDMIINTGNACCGADNFNLVAGGTASIAVGSGDVNMTLWAGNAGGNDYAIVGADQYLSGAINNFCYQGAGISMDNGTHTMEIHSAGDATAIVGDGNLLLTAEVCGDLGVKAGDGMKVIGADSCGDVTVIGGSGDSYFAVNSYGDTTISLESGNSEMNIAAQNAYVEKAAGDLSFKSETTGYTYLKSGAGASDIDVTAGGLAEMHLDNGSADISVVAGAANITKQSLAADTNRVNITTVDYTYLNTGNNSTDIVNVVAGGDAQLELGFGNSDVNLIANNASINTDCGNQTINAATRGDLGITTGCCGTDDIEATVGGNAKIVTSNGSDTVKLDVANSFYVDVAGDGIDTDTPEDDDNVSITQRNSNTSVVNYVGTGIGKDTVSITADSVYVEKGKGELLLGAMGNIFQVDSDADKNTIGAYGNNYTYNLNANADNDIRTLDFWLRDGKDGKKVTMNDGSMMALKDMVDDVKVGGKEMTLTQYDAANNKEAVDFFKDKFAEAFDNKTYIETVDKFELVTTLVEVDGMSKDEIADKYGLSDEERAILKDIDLTETYQRNGVTVPRYAIAKSPHKSAQAGKDVYVIVKGDNWTPAGREKDPTYFHGRSVSPDVNSATLGECIAFNTNNTTLTNITGTQTTSTIYNYTADYKTNGVMDWTIALNGEANGEGKLMANISAYDGQIAIVGNDGQKLKDTANINIIGSHIDSVLKDTKIDKKEDWALSVYLQKSSWNSPLILDMNGDNKISTKAGVGVDTDGDGKADGAATGGDKMLAMSDMTGDKKIGAAEVFGNNTISPFTKQKLNASNGFEALKMIAEEAVARGFDKCIDGTQINIAELAKALESVGVKLGFISDENSTTVEDLFNLKSIDTVYDDKLYEDGEQRQYGTFITEDNEIRRIDDVWFK